MWCPGRLQGPSRLSAGIGVAKWHSPKFLAFLVVLHLERCYPKKKYCCLLKVKIFGPEKIFRLATLLPAGLL